MTAATEAVLDQAIERVVKSDPRTFQPAPDPVAGEGEQVVNLDLDEIVPDPHQPRQDVDSDLAASIEQEGVLQPITVRRHPQASPHAAFIIVDGERRWRGSIKAGRKLIPAIVRDDVDDEAKRLVRQSVSNTGKPLSPLEEAKAWKRVQELTSMNAAQLAKVLGRPKSTVGDRLALAEAPEAFHELFAKGVLSAAAAPIVRQFTEVPNKTLERAVAMMMEQWSFHDAERDGRAVPIETAKRIIESTICYNVMREIPKEIEKEFRGLVVEIKGKRFTPEIERITKLAEDVAARDRSKAAPKVRQPNPHMEAERRRVREGRKKTALRRAQIDAIAPKIPADLDGKWLGFVVDGLVGEMHTDSLRSACKFLGLEPGKRKYGGNDFSGAIRKHAAGLKAPELSRLAVQLILAVDLATVYGSGGPERIRKAADLARVDLKKVKLPEPATKKKGASAIRRDPIFMRPVQPDAVLAAIVGAAPLRRTDMTMKLWKYIKKNGLQDKKERRMINADDKMKALFGGRKKVSMFEMTKLVNKHYRPAP